MPRRPTRLPRTVHPVAALAVGEALLTTGLWMVWVPLAFISLGVQVIAVALLRETPR